MARTGEAMPKLPSNPDKQRDLPEIVKCLARHGPKYALAGILLHRLPWIVGPFAPLITYLVVRELLRMH
jgi:hypothetical protein